MKRVERTLLSAAFDLLLKAGTNPNQSQRLRTGVSALHGESLLPNRGRHPQFFPGPEGESALDELHGALDGHFTFNREQEMKVVRHDHENVQLEFVLCAIFIQNAQEQCSSPVRLQQVLLAPCLRM
jgi:hypothetical protein